MDTTFATMLKLLGSGAPVRQGFQELVGACAAEAPDPAWDELRGLDLDADVARLRDWLTDLLISEPPGPSIVAFWFGLFEEMEADGEETCRLYVSGSPRFDERDWACWDDDSYLHEGRYAGSQVLQSLHQLLAAGGEAARDAGGVVLPLGYAGLAVTELCRTVDPGLLLGAAESRHVAVGWDSGDCIVLGTVRRDGWRANVRVT
jgi:hypothetical protein